VKQGLSLTELASELERRQNVKADFVADTRQLVMASNGTSTLNIADEGEFKVRDMAHRQIGERLGIPRKFYERLRAEHPGLLDHNVNTLFQEKPEKRMVRTLDGDARAFLSNSYRRIDDFDLAEAILPVLNEQPDMRIESCDLTETRMYIKALFPRIQGEVKVGEAVQAGVVIQNSEVGHGMLSVTPLVFTLICSNGMIVPEYGTQRRHVGRRIDPGEEATQLFRDETLAADDRALLMKVADVVRACTNEAAFRDITLRLRELTTTDPMPDPVKGVEKLANRYDLNEEEQGGVLRHLIEGGDLTAYGALNAVTRTAQDVDSYDRSVELERTGGQFMDLTREEWAGIVSPN
jgi:hypothetical protein